MTTIKRMIVILILLAIVFFIYRGISPSGADRLLTDIKNIPVRLGLLSGETVSIPAVSTGTIISTGEIIPTGEAMVFSSTLASGGTFALDALVITQQNDTISDEPISTGGSLVIIQETGIDKPLPVVKPTVVPVVHTTVSAPKTSASELDQAIKLLNNLFR